MASAIILKSSFLPKRSEWAAAGGPSASRQPAIVGLTVRAGSYADELAKTAKTIASPGRGILAMDESNATCGKRLASIGVENTEANRQAYRLQDTSSLSSWRTVFSIPNGPSALAVKEAAWGLARYASIAQDNGLVPIVEPEILLDGEHGIDRTFQVAQKVWAEVFFYLAENNVLFEGILLKPSMVTPGTESKDRATPEQVAEYTLKLIHRRIPRAVPESW
ncbi:hypothetical protein KSP40_PGU011579 [Platanthera guangdongensis]|uniref:Fructose-bisphosphate aldolase n=1 Tax=Platanthera guangdongensis TaxID=2320717 RepID=A0ABR2MTH6_9ASPA